MCKGSVPFTPSEDEVIKQLAGKITAKEIAKRLGRTYRQVSNRGYKLGLSMSCKNKLPKEVSIKAKKNGVSMETVKCRLAAGYSIEEAVQNKDYRSKNGEHKYVWNGIKGAPAIAKSLNVSLSTLYNHIRRCDGSIEDALDSMKRSRQLQARSESKPNKLKVVEPKPKPIKTGEMVRPNLSATMALALGIGGCNG
ncbi:MULTISPECIES: hypothetical protein [unclassified Vibrio]|uniref:hypothetical protein n=1 Tax=unclassified Vibrio TaxID=2614977 RepID=UPI001267D577|nr:MULTISPECIES: hypothetical protein [unclassified Vibrio]QFT40042.1 hypothetical protein FIU99_27000 [Vibrio sp. THAF64]QGM37987.1 hypothetical protein GGC04_27205 [Vibrio sp. THAF191d]QGN73433.1 hypothetical protein GGC03_26970 [Vibrio sp. THAF191c]